MSRNALNLWLDVVFFIALLGLIATGGILHFVLPPGTGRSFALFGLGRHDFGALHGYLAVLSIGLLIAHLVLHWSWVVCVVGRGFEKERPSRFASSVAGFLLLSGILAALGAGLFWASSQVKSRSTPRIQNADRGRESARSADAVWNRHDSSAEEPAAGTRLDSRGGHWRRSIALAADKHDEECAASRAIDGRTSLRRAAELAGASVAEARLYFELPQHVDSEESLGRLKRAYGLSIHDLRRWACKRNEE
ncbi:MAG: DUF4405 domain-containing protein [Vicinamibacteria bacterium]|nr:DUF4405 domain-containing protein [Vicinamibacteria bacterium]